MSYHVSRDGRQLGDFSLEDILAKLASGELRADDHGWIHGMTTWSSLGEIARAAPPLPPAATYAPVPTGEATEPPQLPSAELDESTSLSAQAGSASAAKHRGRPRRRAKPNNHLFSSILVTLFCCLPLGIIAIVYASQVNGKHHAGNYAGAREAAHKAKNWMWITLGVGLLGWFLYAAFVLAGGIMGD